MPTSHSFTCQFRRKSAHRHGIRRRIPGKIPGQTNDRLNVFMVRGPLVRKRFARFYGLISVEP